MYKYEQLEKKKAEDAKISVRNARREGNDLLKQEKQEGNITEDLLNKGEKEIQNLTDQFCKNIDEYYLQLAAIKDRRKQISCRKNI